jgi:hypothetical protein
MAKIDEEIFNSVADEANLKEKKQDNDEIQRYVMVYDVPKHWLNQLKKNKLKASQYFKQAVMEKLQRDGMIDSK